MRVLHVVTAVHKAGGGTSEIIPRICQELVAAGVEVRLVSGKYAPLADSAIEAGMHGVDMRFGRPYEIPHLGFLRVTSEFKQEIIEGTKWANIVHLHGHWQDAAWWTPAIARKLGKPYVMQSHGFLEPERIKKSALAKKIFGALFERPNLDRASAVIATAESEKVGIEQFGVKTPIDVVPLGLDTTKIDAAPVNKVLISKLGLDLNKKTVLYFSRITPIKGLDLLADVWAGLGAAREGWQLLIAGPDDRGYATIIKEEYDHKITDGSVHFSGPIYGDDKYKLLKSVDAFVLPTRSENWSIAVQEALAAGLPTVCTKGAPWRVLNEGAGYWVDVSVEAIQEGLRKILTASDANRAEMGRVGKAIVARDFQWPAVTKKLIAVYEKILKASR